MTKPRKADPLRIKLINLLHTFGQGETEEHDGEKIDEMVIRIVAERDQARAALELESAARAAIARATAP